MSQSPAVEPEFVRLVREMRYYQTRYFAERTKRMLTQAKAYEVLVDKVLGNFARFGVLAVNVPDSTPRPVQGRLDLPTPYPAHGGRYAR